jgi:ATP-dependent 26S proteasome regulatory subunit
MPGNQEGGEVQKVRNDETQREKPAIPGSIPAFKPTVFPGLRSDLLNFTSSREHSEGFGGGSGKPPKKDAPPRPDREPGGEHKFKVRIEDAKTIFEQLKEGTPRDSCYDFGSTPLEYPLENVSVTGISDGQRFSSLVQFGLDSDFREERYSEEGNKGVPFSEQYLNERFKTKKIGNDILILDDNGKPEFYIGRQPVLQELMIGVGRDRSMGVGPVPLKKLTNFADFKPWIEKYASVVETAINAVYEGKKQWSPDMELVFRPQMKERGITSIENMMAKLGGKTAESLKDKLQVEKPNISFEDIGGQDKAKREIQGLSFAIKNPELYKKWGTKPPKGILLYGPPGTGKTLMAKALATEADANFLSISISDITSKWYGESEKLMQEVFDLAKDSEGKTILFFDEVDAIAPERDNASEASRRIVSTMLTKLDGIGSNPNVMVVCATNRLEAIDPALTRPGRLDKLVEVPLPDADGRKQIFKIHIKQADKLAGRELFNGVDFDEVVNKTDKTSGADIAEIIRRTLEEKVRQEGAYGSEPGAITTKDIVKEIEGYERVKQDKKKIGFNTDR